MTDHTQIALISAGAALSGVLLTQITTWVVSYLDRRYQKKVLLRQKYEEVGFLFVSSLRWVSQLNEAKDNTLPELTAHSIPIPSRQLHALCMIYFPRLFESATEYLNAHIPLFDVVVKSFNKGIPVNAGGQAIKHNEDAYMRAVNYLETAKCKLDNSIRDNADYYVQA